MGLSCYQAQRTGDAEGRRFNALMGLSCYKEAAAKDYLSGKFQCPHGLELLLLSILPVEPLQNVSMPSWAWVVTARMSNILNFSWYFLCIPAIYRCILAYLPFFFNQLSKFLRCESPSTFLGTCLSHHSFIIFLVTNTNTLLSGLFFAGDRHFFLHIEKIQKIARRISPTGNCKHQCIIEQ